MVFGSALNMVFITARSVLRQISAFLRLLCWNRYKKAGTQVLEPYLSFILFAPQEYLSRAYHDAVKYDAVIETTSLKNNEAILTGEIPARRIGEYKSDLNFYTNGRSVCLTELKGYQETSGEPVVQPRRPNSRLDKVRHMFQKIM